MRTRAGRDLAASIEATLDRESIGGVESVTECPLCQSPRLSLLFSARDTLHSMPGEWGVHRCPGCGLMMTSPRPDSESISRYYPPDYQPFGVPHAPSMPEGRLRWLKVVARRFLDPKEHVLPSGIAPGRALEVGCGSGRYLAQLVAAGWQVQGLEPSAETASRVRETTGLPVTVGSIQNVSFEPATFDLVVAVMVLEHLHEPLKDLRKIRSWLLPGGSLTGSVPNAASWEFRFFGPRWYALQVPTHLFHYTPQTLTRVLEKSGFKNIKVAHQRNVNNLMIHLGRFLARHNAPWAQTCLDFPERGPTALRYAVRPLASLLAWLRQAGRISFTAERA